MKPDKARLANDELSCCSYDRLPWPKSASSVLNMVPVVFDRCGPSRDVGMIAAKDEGRSYATLLLPDFPQRRDTGG